MMNKKRIIGLMLAALAVGFVQAQAVRSRTSSPVVVAQDTLKGVMGKYFKVRTIRQDGKLHRDTISTLYDETVGLLDYARADSAAHFYSDPSYYRFFMPLYYNDPIDGKSKITWTPSRQAGRVPLADKDYVPGGVLADDAAVSDEVNGSLMNAYVNAPQGLTMMEDYLNSTRSYSDNLRKENKAKTKAPIVRLVKRPGSSIYRTAGIEAHKPNWWDFTGSASFQATQIYLTDNWYQGGESNISALATLQLSANYNDKEKLQWENLLDVKAGFTTTPSDLYHDYLFSTNQLRLYSKLGLQAYKNWYYTASLEFKTQIFNGYTANTEPLLTSFLAPADLTMGLGMDYKKKTKTYTFSILFAPITYTVRYVGNSRVDETYYGLDEGKKWKHDFGLQFQPTLDWKIASNINLNTRFNYLTSYHWVRVEWETTLDFSINKWLSTKFYVVPRFDDSSTPLVGDSYMQLKELLSFGLSYTW